MAAPDFGLESLLRLQPIDTKKNALIVLVHFVLTKHGWFYVGRGTEWKDGEAGSETLPPNWASSDEPYRYVSRSEPKKKFTVKFTEQDVFLIVSMVNVEEQQAISMNINASTEVNAANFASNNPRLVYPKLLELLPQIYDQLVRPCQVGNRSVGTSTMPASSSDRPDRTHPGLIDRPSRGPPLAPHPLGEPENPLLRGEVPLGRRDLDPFAGPGPGGGMVVDPLRVIRDERQPGPLGPDGIPLPRGAVPPGARFDPFFPEGAIRPDVGFPPDMDPFGGPGRFRPPRGPFGRGQGGEFGGGPFGGGGPGAFI